MKQITALDVLKDEEQALRTRLEHVRNLISRIERGELVTLGATETVPVDGATVAGGLSAWMKTQTNITPIAN